MKKKSAFAVGLFAAALMIFSACSNSDNEGTDASGEVGQLKFDLRFEGTNDSNGSRAPGSTAIPITSWSNIRQVQFFLYDAGGIVRYAVTETPTASRTYTYGDVPVGTYTLVAVANAKSTTDAVITEVPSLGVTPWNDFNVRSKLASKLRIQHKPATFPPYANPSGNTAYAMPAEVFMAEAANITISSGSTATPPTLKLKREVSLMRVRVNVADTDGGVNNSSGANGVDWTQKASILIYRLPKDMGITAGNSGGVSSESITANVMVAATSFNAANPATGYNPTVILGGNFTMWKDVVVFPNNGGRASDGNFAGIATPTRQYFIVLSAKGKIGHMLADGTTLTTETTVYWNGLIKGNFERNYIREVNLTLKSGGTTVVPVTPVQQGTLVVGLSNPEPWNANIQDEHIIL